jgi:hypothetical protein
MKIYTFHGAIAGDMTDVQYSYPRGSMLKYSVNDSLYQLLQSYGELNL